MPSISVVYRPFDGSFAGVLYVTKPATGLEVCGTLSTFPFTVVSLRAGGVERLFVIGKAAKRDFFFLFDRIDPS